MTKCIVLGEEPKEEEKKPIEFRLWFCSTENCATTSVPTNFKNVELVCRRHNGTDDLMFAYDHRREGGSLFLGHWNDGVV